jgi:hypothetical protein
MICAHEQCTGKHSNGISVRLLCFNAVAKKRERDRRYYKNHRQARLDYMQLYNLTAAGILASVRANAKRRGL